jgi:hypothetical protein
VQLGNEEAKRAKEDERGKFRAEALRARRSNSARSKTSRGSGGVPKCNLGTRRLRGHGRSHVPFGNEEAMRAEEDERGKFRAEARRHGGGIQREVELRGDQEAFPSATWERGGYADTGVPTCNLGTRRLRGHGVPTCNLGTRRLRGHGVPTCHLGTRRLRGHGVLARNLRTRDLRANS